MSVTNPATSRLHDPKVPELSSLLAADEVPGPLAAVYGDELRSAVARQVTWWPGKSLSVKFRATGADDSERDVVAVAGRIPDGAMVVESDQGRVGVWEAPHDPVLTGLASAMDPDSVSAMLRSLGLASDDISLRVRAYRPTRRAVIEVRSGQSSPVFLKLVAPDVAEELHRAHRALSAELKVPNSLGVDRQRGIVVLERLPGATLRATFDDPARAVPSPETLDGLLTALPTLEGARIAKSPIERLRRLTPVLEAVVPDQRDRIRHMVDAIGPDDVPATTPVHGDFYEAQILVRDGKVSGLLDIDTLGLGRPGDDPATMLGHLASWRGSSRHPERVSAYANQTLALWDTKHDPVDLRRRVAAVLIGLSTGPFRVQRLAWPTETVARLDLAERWVESADSVRERTLTPATDSSHRRPGY